MEDFAYILDYLPQGHPDSKRFHREPIAFGLGTNEFKLLELAPKPDATIKVGEQLYIGKDASRRDKVLHVKRRVGFEELTSAAQNELAFILPKVVQEQEARFVKFFNEAQPISTRFHMLELLPGLGKKILWVLLEEKKKGPLLSFEDIARRVPTLHHPEKVIAKRIEMEISENQKYHLFTAR